MCELMYVPLATLLLLHVTNSSLHHGYDVSGSLGSTEMMSLVMSCNTKGGQ